jgi:hypothetical protein
MHDGCLAENGVTVGGNAGGQRTGCGQQERPRNQESDDRETPKNHVESSAMPFQKNLAR